MKIQTIVALLLIPSFSLNLFAENKKRADFTGCLKSISENSTQFKGKVFSLSDDGWSYAVHDEKTQDITVFSDGEVYKMGGKNKSCKTSTPEAAKGKSGAGLVAAIYVEAMKDTKNTPLEARTKIKEDCATVAPFSGQIPTGMMMGGTGMVMTGDGMMSPDMINSGMMTSGAHKKRSGEK